MSPLRVSAADEMYEREEAARETREPMRGLRRVIGREVRAESCLTGIFDFATLGRGDARGTARAAAPGSRDERLEPLSQADAAASGARDVSAACDAILIVAGEFARARAVAVR